MQDDFKVTEELIESKLKKLEDSETPGIDGNVPEILNANAVSLSRPLKLVYKKSVKTGKVPVDSKRANVTAVFMKGCRETAWNHRPVSLTSHICKVWKHLFGILLYTT
jgi:hypothetical protein